MAGTVEAVDTKEQAITTSGGDRLPYDALVLAVGAEPEPAVDHAMTWDDRTGSELIGGLMRDFEPGYSQSLAVVIPAGPGWPLRGYELALLITLQAKGMGIEPATTVVVQEPSALSILGAGAVDVLWSELTGAGITVVSTANVEVDPGRPIGLVLRPSGCRVMSTASWRLRPCTAARSRASPADLAGLPAGRYLEAWLAVGDDEGPTTHLPSGRLPMLSYLQRDLEAGWRGAE